VIVTERTLTGTMSSSDSAPSTDLLMDALREEPRFQAVMRDLRSGLKLRDRSWPNWVSHVAALSA
jgi:hypothetical protein